VPHFIEPVINRSQYLMGYPTLDDVVPANHVVRAFEDILQTHDWSGWDSQYSNAGQRPYAPRLLATLLVYAYSRRLRSSRQIEEACQTRDDFRWLMSGRVPDHDTICAFRRQHGKELKTLFRFCVRYCVEHQLTSLSKLITDGTRVRASNSNDATATLATIEERLARLDARIAEVLAEAEQEDQRDDALFGPSTSASTLQPGELRRLQEQKARHEQAKQKVLAKMERAQQQDGASDEQAAAKRVPVTDPDADVMKNKEGGFAANYTPWVGVTAEGFIASQGVSNAHTDAPHLVESIEQAQANTGQKVGQAQADSGYATVENIEYCENNEIDPCIAPVCTSLERAPEAAKIPAWPGDVPVTAPHANGTTVDGLTLPRTERGQFAKSAFTYDLLKNCYVCPTGRTLAFAGTEKRRRGDRIQERYAYKSKACSGCPFRPVCTTSKTGRTVHRTQDEPIHERQRERMRDAQRRADYRLRRCTVEPTIGILKHQLGLRRFLLRGLDGAGVEWTLASTAFDVAKLIRMQRAKGGSAGRGCAPTATENAETVGMAA
jgi:transposase